MYDSYLFAIYPAKYIISSFNPFISLISNYNSFISNSSKNAAFSKIWNYLSIMLQLLSLLSSIIYPISILYLFSLFGYSNAVYSRLGDERAYIKDNFWLVKFDYSSVTI